MKTTSRITFRELFKSARNTLPYLLEGAIIEFTEHVMGRMKSLNFSRTDLAAKLGSSSAYVTKVLKGDTNFTLESMVKISDALDSELRLELVPKTTVIIWAEVAEKRSPSPKPESTFWANTNRIGERKPLANRRFDMCLFENEYYRE